MQTCEMFRFKVFFFEIAFKGLSLRQLGDLCQLNSPLFEVCTFCITVDGNTWAQVIALYPTLVECITCSSSEVCSALKEALVPFKDFMQPPASKVQNGES